MKHVLRALETAAFVLSWLPRAMADGKVTVIEMSEFVSAIARIWKIRVDIAVPRGMVIEDLAVTGQFEEDD